MLKKQVNRYTIAQVASLETRKIRGGNYLKELFEKINKYNSNSKNPYFIGNIEVINNMGIVTFVKYKKITVPTTLEDIDSKTVFYNSDHDLKQLYGINFRNKHPFVIVYRANKKINTLPIVYKKRKEYLDKEFVRCQFKERGKDIEFLNMILNNKLIEASSFKSVNELDQLYALREMLKYNDSDSVSLSRMSDFYNAYIYQGGKFNYYNFRKLAMLLLEYDEKLEVKEEDTLEEAQDEVIGQMMLEDFAISELRDYYEELKLGIGQGSLEEVYQKKLISKHKTTK